LGRKAVLVKVFMVDREYLLEKPCNTGVLENWIGKRQFWDSEQ
jgi:hypothetical protein